MKYISSSDLILRLLLGYSAREAAWLLDLLANRFPFASEILRQICSLGTESDATRTSMSVSLDANY